MIDESARSEQHENERLEKARQQWGAGAESATEYSGAARFEANLPLEQLVESELNPRKRFNEEAMRELEASIREKGVVTPLLVRPLGIVDGAPRFEIAAGHRRSRAGRAAGRTEVPALIRGMADNEFMEILVLENDQREDVHALEEARGYETLLRLPGYDVAKIAAKVGRSAKYVYDRLKLLQLTPAAQELFLEDRFTAGHAILLARLKPEDQERAIHVDDDMRFGRAEGMFVNARSLPFDDDEVERLEKADPYALVKPISVREFEAWIQHNVRVEPEHVDAFLFPETARVLEEHADDRLGVILITREYRASDDVRGAGKDRVFGEQAWQRADGEEKSKTCDHSRLGLVACGPGQGATFLVCVNKKCAVHWAAWQKEKKKRQADATGSASKASADERWKIQRKKRDEEHARNEAERKRWEKARPQLLAAFAEKVKSAPTKASGLLAGIVLRAVDEHYGGIGKEAAKHVPVGKTAEDVVRAAAFIVLTREVHNRWAVEEIPKRAKAFGIDARAIVDQVVPPAPPAAQTSAKGPGTCRKCGCTEDAACAGGCGWADGTKTRCTTCFPPKATSAAKKAKKKGRR